MARRASINALLATTAVAGVGIGSWQVLQSGSPGSLFQGTFQALCYVQQPFTGISVRFDRVRGSLRDGQLDFEGLRVVWDRSRLIAQKFECDLEIDHLTVDVGAENATLIMRETQVFSKRLDSVEESDAFRVKELSIKGCRGHYVALIRKPETPPPNILIALLHLEDVNVQVGDMHQRSAVLRLPDISVDSLTMEMIRFQNAVPALLLGTQGHGAIGGVPFKFEKRKHASISLPIQWLAQFLQAPLSWIHKGHAGVDVTLTPSRADHAIVTVNLSLENGEAKEDASDSMYGSASGQLAAYMSSKHIGLTAKEEINLDDTDGKRLLNRLNEKFATVLIRDGLAGSLNLAAEELKKRGWF